MLTRPKQLRKVPKPRSGSVSLDSSPKCHDPPFARSLNLGRDPPPPPQPHPCVLAPHLPRSPTRLQNPSRGPRPYSHLLLRTSRNRRSPLWATGISRCRRTGPDRPVAPSRPELESGRVTTSAPPSTTPPSSSPALSRVPPVPAPRAPPLTWAVQREVADPGVAPEAAETPGELLVPCGRGRWVWAPLAFPSPRPFGPVRGWQPPWVPPAGTRAPPSLRSLAGSHHSSAPGIFFFLLVCFGFRTRLL